MNQAYSVGAIAIAGLLLLGAYKQVSKTHNAHKPEENHVDSKLSRKDSIETPQIPEPRNSEVSPSEPKTSDVTPKQDSESHVANEKCSEKAKSLEKRFKKLKDKPEGSLEDIKQSVIELQNSGCLKKLKSKKKKGGFKRAKYEVLENGKKVILPQLDGEGDTDSSGSSSSSKSKSSSSGEMETKKSKSSKSSPSKENYPCLNQAKYMDNEFKKIAKMPTSLQQGRFNDMKLGTKDLITKKCLRLVEGSQGSVGRFQAVTYEVLDPTGDVLGTVRLPLIVS